MSKKLGVLLLALVTMTLTVWAQDNSSQGGGPGGPGGPPPMGGHGPHGPGPQFWKNSDIATKLNLSSTQVTQLDAAFAQHKPNLQTNMKNMRASDQALRTLLEQDNPDQTQVNSAVNQVLSARAALERETTMMMLDFRKVLTAAQWKQLRELHPMGPGFGGPHKWGGHGGPNQGGPNGPPSDEQAPPPPQD
jgi:Spy/CpxP family protein refolding chaperone